MAAAATSAPRDADPGARAPYDPRETVLEILRRSMELRFAGPAMSLDDRAESLRAIQRLTHDTARRLLVDTWVPPESDATAPTVDAPIPAAVTVAPPRAFFVFRENGRMQLPLIDWAAFRGYSVALWLNVESIRPQSNAARGRFQLFRFTNNSSTLGVEAALEFERDGDPLLVVGSCSPGQEPKRSPLMGMAVVGASSVGADWRYVAHRVPLRARQWHLLVITHSLHYVKKSHITCVLDTETQFTEEIAYPSGLVNASRCAVGGGNHSDVRVASVAMYHEELSTGVIDSMYCQGPDAYPFRRWMTVPTGTSVQHIVDIRDTTPNSTLALPIGDRIAAYSKHQVVFSFVAADAMNDEFPDLAVEWCIEGSMGTKGKWVTMDMVTASSEMQQRNARLGKSVLKIRQPHIKESWFRALGIEAVPVLLRYILAGFQQFTMDSKQASYSEAVVEELTRTTETVVMDLFQILRGLLLNHLKHVDSAVRSYVFHLLSYAIRQYSDPFTTFWTPASVTVCAEVVKDLRGILPWRGFDDRPRNHPTQPSVWTWNPVFATAVRAILLDFRIWSHLNYKTQSIFNHQLYSIACENPKLLHDLSVVPRVLDILHHHYSIRTATRQPETSTNAQEVDSNNKDDQWREQSIQTLVDVIEVCLSNQSVLVHPALEQELLDTTFAKASRNQPISAGIQPTATSGSQSSTASTPARQPSVPLTASQQGGVFHIGLENIIWSDQTSASRDFSDEDKSKKPDAPPISALPAVEVRFSLLRDVRSIVRYLAACEDSGVQCSLLLLLRRLCVSYLDIRFALVSSNIMDCLLYLMRPRYCSRESNCTDSIKSDRVRMACTPLFIYLLDWLESVEGRTVWCGVEEHLRFILNGEGNYTRGFLELMMEFYFDPTWLTGAQQGIIMNDPSKKDSVLFPISPINGKAPLSRHGIVVADDGFGDIDSLDSSRTNTLNAWIKMATSFSGKRLSLSWEKRIQVVRMAALRNLASEEKSEVDQESTEHRVVIAEAFDEGISGILNLPLKGVLPFLPVLIKKNSPHVREKILMDINVKLKTDEALQDQILHMKKEWTEALLELSIVCSSPELDVTDTTKFHQEKPDTNSARLRQAAYSFDSHKTGEDLVLDTIVSLLCGAMQHNRGWKSFADLITGLKVVQNKYSRSAPQSPSRTSHAATVPPQIDLASISDTEVLLHPLSWMCRATAIVLQRMARSRTILSKVLADNVQKTLILVQESLLDTPQQHCPVLALDSSRPESQVPQRASGSYVWSQSQVSLLTAVLDVCTRLVDSTHKLHRTGLVPGIQILQRSLAYIDGEVTLTERISMLLEKAFQHEMNVASAVRVFDHLTPREVFLNALVCLRRALLLQPQHSHDVINPLRLLTLKLCTSELFMDDLHSAGLTVQALSEMSEETAVAAVLDGLGIMMNEAEMHERDEEADFVPLFPNVNELRRNDGRVLTAQKNKALDPDPFAVAFAGGQHMLGVDDNERSLWAALEVEENRVRESFRDIVNREKKRLQVLKDMRIPQRDAWVDRLWHEQEYRFRSQHSYHSLSHHPTIVHELSKTFEYRIGVYETSFPRRARPTLDVFFPPVRSGSCSPSRKHVSDNTSEVDTCRKDFSRCFAHQRGESTLSSGDGDGSQLLQRVSRVVAEKGGGEIRDITMDVDSANGEPESEAQNQSHDDADPDSPKKGSEPQHIDDEIPSSVLSDSSIDLNSSLDTTQPIPHKSPAEVGAIGSTQLPPGLWHIDVDRHIESGRDPSEGIALSTGEQILAQANCRRVIPEGVILGNLYYCHKYLVFVPAQSLDIVEDDSSTSSRGQRASTADEAAPGIHRCWRWKYKHIVSVYLRRYRLRDSAIEVFLRNGTNHFLDFPHVVKQQRNELAKLLYSFLPRFVPKQIPDRGITNLSQTTKAWQSRSITNFEYLMALNTFAGRSFNDLTQYPIFPWVLSNYEDEKLDLSDPKNFRDLSKPMGALNPTRLEEYWERYNSFDDPVIPKFLYGSHYSTCAGVVLFFLVRLQPFANLHRKMQGNDFDLPDRLFNSIKESWDMCNSQMSEVKELTPEFFCDSSFLKNSNGFNLGKRHDKKSVDDVVLPPWARGSPNEFIRIHRAALESEHVSQHLHEWIDLIFGFKQRGKAALKANNVFYYLTYYGVVDLDRIDDPFLRESMELQIAHFGQCPMQLFGSPHPKRNVTSLTRRLNGGSVSSPPPSTVASSSLSSGNRSPVGTPTMGTFGSPPVCRPLSATFTDASTSAQELRRQWSPPIDIKPLAKSPIRWIRIFPDRILTLNDLGVVEVYVWKLTSKPQPVNISVDLQSLSRSSSADAVLLNARDDVPRLLPLQPQTVRGVSEGSASEASSLGDGDGENVIADDPRSPSGLTCPWILEVIRDDSPFDIVPRVPVFHTGDAGNNGFPVVASCNGRVIITGGAPNGSLQLRLVDLDNGHVIARASVSGHDSRVTCLSVDRFSYSTPSGQMDGDELVVSGSMDGTLSVWRINRLKPDLLFRNPRISSCPLFILRGHNQGIVCCSVNTFVNAVASCSPTMALVHLLHDNGAVSFSASVAELSTRVLGAGRSPNVGVFKGIEVSSKGFVVMLVIVEDYIDSNSSDELRHHSSTSFCVVLSLSGQLISSRVFEGTHISRLGLSAEGDLVMLTVYPGLICFCRLDDLVTVQEYHTPPNVEAPISALSVGPVEATILAVSGHHDGSIVLHLLPDADGSVSFLSNLRRLLGMTSKFKIVKGTVQQAQSLAMSTLGNAKAVTTTARDIAGEALGEAKSIVKGFISYLRQNQST